MRSKSVPIKRLQCSVFLRIQGNGFCDCGDPEAFLQHHLCRIHEEASKNEVSAREVLESFPNDLRIRTKELFRIILQYIISMTATRKSKFDEWKVGPKVDLVPKELNHFGVIADLFR